MKENWTYKKLGRLPHLLVMAIGLKADTNRN